MRVESCALCVHKSPRAVPAHAHQQNTSEDTPFSHSLMLVFVNFKSVCGQSLSGWFLFLFKNEIT